MWVLRAYDTRTDELRLEFPLLDFSVDYLDAPLTPENLFGSLPLSRNAACRIATRHARMLPTDDGTLEFFLDFELRPQAVLYKVDRLDCGGWSVPGPARTFSHMARLGRLSVVRAPWGMSTTSRTRDVGMRTDFVPQ